MLNSDDPLFAFFPPRYHAKLKHVISDLKQGDTSSLISVKEYCLELYSLLTFNLEFTQTYLCSFVEALIQQVQSTHAGILILQLD